MKNMKRTILGVAILAMVLIMMMGSVNAANVTANNTEVKKGDMVAVSVNTENAAMAIEFELKYDATKFEYIGASAGALGTPSVTDEGGVITLAIAASDGRSTTQSVTLNFKAKETTEGVPFTVSNLITDKNEAVANSTATVKVVEEKPVTPEEPTNPTQPTTPDENKGGEETTTNNSQNANEKIGTNGEVIKKLPQTGTPVFIGVAAIIVVAGMALVVRKTK